MHPTRIMSLQPHSPVGGRSYRHSHCTAEERDLELRERVQDGTAATSKRSQHKVRTSLLRRRSHLKAIPCRAPVQGPGGWCVIQGERTPEGRSGVGKDAVRLAVGVAWVWPIRGVLCLQPPPPPPNSHLPSMPCEQINVSLPELKGAVD